MREDEARVTAAFAGWLRDEGWTVRVEVDHVDVGVERGDSRLYAEVAAGGRHRQSVEALMVHGGRLSE